MKRIKVFTIIFILSLYLCTFSFVNASDDNIYQSKDYSVISTRKEKKEKSNRSLSSAIYKYTNKTEPYNPQGKIRPLLRQVIGTDERIRNLSTSEYPLCAVAYMVIQFPYGTKQGTAFMVYNNIALTAGHCAYVPELGGWATSITLYPGINGNETENQFNAAAHTYITNTNLEMTISSNYYNQGSWNEDWAILELGDNLGNSTGWYGLEAYQDYSQLINQFVSVTGYPGYPDIYGTVEHGQYTSGGYITYGDNNVIYHNADTTGGESGGPVCKNAGYAMAIISRQFDDYPLNIATNTNQNLINEVINLIN